MNRRTVARLKSGVAVIAVLAQLAILAGPAAAFCGFYVAQADAKLFNKSSKVVLARNGDSTAITMASDYEGTPKEFALVIPVPTFIERKQIGVVDMKTIDHIDAFTAPRLVEYSDPDPCAPLPVPTPLASAGGIRLSAMSTPPILYRGVTVEASYDVGEYDVSILSATESDGLVNWLNGNGYKIPAGADAVLSSYIKQKMHFFVAKVNLDRMHLLGNSYLRPLQVRYESPKFMLPLRLGTVNANGPQDLIVYALSANGRVETANYRTVKVPSDMDVPLYVKDEFGSFYKAMFDRAVEREHMQAVFVEYAWDMSWCDPCASAPMSNKELVELGARWIGNEDASPLGRGGPSGMGVFVTRLHVRYDAKSFPEDLALLETHDRTNFQGRYVMHHPWRGDATCKAATQYREALATRFGEEAQNLAQLTGWPRPDIEARMQVSGETTSSGKQ